MRVSYAAERLILAKARDKTYDGHLPAAIAQIGDHVIDSFERHSESDLIHPLAAGKKLGPTSLPSFPIRSLGAYHDYSDLIQEVHFGKSFNFTM